MITKDEIFVPKELVKEKIDLLVEILTTKIGRAHV